MPLAPFLVVRDLASRIVKRDGIVSDPDMQRTVNAGIACIADLLQLRATS